MKNYVKNITRVLPVFVLLIALVVGVVPSAFASTTYEEYGKSIRDWTLSIDSLYQADFTHVGAHVSFGRTLCQWNVAGNIITGISADFGGKSSVVVSPFGENPLSLLELTPGTVIFASCELNIDPIYSGYQGSYFSVIRYYDLDMNQIHMERSADMTFTYAPPGSLCIDFAHTIQKLYGNTAFCKVELYLDLPAGIPVTGSLATLSTDIVLDNNLIALFTGDRLTHLEEELFHCYNIMIEEAGGFLFVPFDGFFGWVSETLSTYFKVFASPEIVDPFGGYVDREDFNGIAGNAAQFLNGFSAAFVVAGYLFNRFVSIPFVSALLSVSLVLGFIMAFFGIAMQFPARSIERQKPIKITVKQYNGKQTKNTTKKGGG